MTVSNIEGMGLREMSNGKQKQMNRRNKKGLRRVKFLERGTKHEQKQEFELARMTEWTLTEWVKGRAQRELNTGRSSCGDVTEGNQGENEETNELITKERRS